jgi:hypothetical protein
MAKVFIVESRVDYEVGEVVAVFSSKEKAKKYVEETLECHPPTVGDIYQFIYSGTDRGHCNGADILEFEIDG